MVNAKLKRGIAGERRALLPVDAGNTCYLYMKVVLVLKQYTEGVIVSRSVA